MPHGKACLYYRVVHTQLNFHNFSDIVCLVCKDAESKQVLRTIKTSWTLASAIAFMLIMSVGFLDRPKVFLYFQF